LGDRLREDEPGEEGKNKKKRLKGKNKKEINLNGERLLLDGIGCAHGMKSPR